MRSLLLALLLLSLAPVALADDEATYAASQPTSVAVTLVSERSTYKSGEDVRLKIIVRNTCGCELAILFIGPQNDTRLFVTDATGATLSPNIASEAPMFAPAGAVTNMRLKPGETVLDTQYALGDQDVAADPEYRAGFVSSRWWGFSFAKPGKYTIVARRVLLWPNTVASQPNGVFSPPSNPVAITITN